MKTAYYFPCLLSCLVILISALNTISVSAQGMGGMGGMGRGMRGSRNNMNQQQVDNTPDPPPKVKNPFASDAPAVEGLEEKTTVMETFVFGHPQKKQLIEKRVQRLEKKLVPYEHHDSDKDLDARVDHLWTMLSDANKQ